MARGDMDDESSGGDDDDDGLDNDDMEALRRACMITGTNPDAIDGGDSDDGDEDDSDTDDLDLLRSIQARFSIPSSRLDFSSGPVVKPLITSLLSANSEEDEDEDEDDDFETLRAIKRRFEQYDNDTLRKKSDKCSHEAAMGATSADVMLRSINAEPLSQEYGSHTAAEPLGSISSAGLDTEHYGLSEFHRSEDGICHLSGKPLRYSRFPESVQLFIDALKKNRSCQKFIRNKLIEIEARIEENKELRARMKCLMGFEVACKRRGGRDLSQKKDPRVRLISLPKSRTSSTPKVNVTKFSPLYSGPPENSHVSKYKMVLKRFPVSLYKQLWSKTEKENLVKGIKQQYQERVILNTMEFSSGLEGTIGDPNSLSASLTTDFEFTSESIRAFLPMVNWERLASMYLRGRSGAECEARWLNSEDPLISHDPWTIFEDKNLLFNVQRKGVYNWIDIATSMGTRRTPFQCLVRYQRSLNSHIIKKDWTEDEDSQLRAAVEIYGEDNWQIIASNVEGRTGPQCSNRWRKTLHPDRRRVGRWSVDEDKRLKVAVLLFGAKNWNKIAQFAPGRTQAQCRERWLNCLDPSLNLEPWTEEEDSKLQAAITEFGYCWSKVATCVPPRTDNQCRRRWKVLLPHEVPLLQAARRLQKTFLISNFVDREREKPSIGPNDFCSIPQLVLSGEHIEEEQTIKKRPRKQKINAESSKGKPIADGPLDLPEHKMIRKKRERKKSVKLVPRDECIELDVHQDVIQHLECTELDSVVPNGLSCLLQSSAAEINCGDRSATGVCRQRGPRKRQGKGKTPEGKIVSHDDFRPSSVVISSSEQVNRGKTRKSNSRQGLKSKVQIDMAASDLSRPIGSRKRKAKDQTLKENSATERPLGLSEDKTNPNKRRKKKSAKLLLNKDTCIEPDGDWEHIQHMDSAASNRMSRTDDVAESSAAYITCQDRTHRCSLSKWPQEAAGKAQIPVDGLISPDDLCPLSELISSNEQVNKGKTRKFSSSDVSQPIVSGKRKAKAETLKENPVADGLPGLPEDKTAPNKTGKKRSVKRLPKGDKCFKLAGNQEVIQQLEHTEVDSAALNKMSRTDVLMQSTTRDLTYGDRTPIDVHHPID